MWRKIPGLCIGWKKRLSSPDSNQGYLSRCLTTPFSPGIIVGEYIQVDYLPSHRAAIFTKCGWRQRVCNCLATAWRPLAYLVSQLLYSYQILEAVLNCLKCSLRWKIFIFFPLLQSDSTAIFLGRSGRNWSFSLSNLQTNNSKQLLKQIKTDSLFVSLS